jgi:uncharacterized LabA/DUF88 family protein/cold shock CspA family protein
MIPRPDEKLTRIGIFYDGGYFSVVSDYYRYQHQRKQRLSVYGLHYFVKHKVAKLEGVDEHYCQVVDAHYFRGRFSAIDSQRANKLFSDRAFDDVLMRAGVVTHYLPRTAQGEKGIDVWLALEAFELAIYKRFNVLVLVAGDGDYLPLVGKVNTLGTRVMLLAWDLEFQFGGRPRYIKVAKALLDEVTYVLHMPTLIDNGTRDHAPEIDGLFVSTPEEEQEETNKGSTATPSQPPAQMLPVEIGVQRKGRVKIQKGKSYGFIVDDEPGQQEWFFIANNVLEPPFQQLKDEDEVCFVVEENPKGGLWATRVKKV